MPENWVDKLVWWKKTTIYQVYPRSYKDSSNNGIGDIPGIISKLDYLQDLGIETIWFSPFFASPQADHGYDISGYRSIAPEYGTMADCNRLIEEIHSRDMRIVLDMVLNHTSNQHPWFLESRSSRENQKRDWYIWCDGRKPGGKKPPNNWCSMVGGSGWHYDDLTEQWYWAQFLPFQPDLNYRNPKVKEEMFDTVRYWLDKGIDGFRLDIINTIYEGTDVGKNNPFALQFLPSEDNRRSFFQDHVHTINHPDNFVFVKELRKVMNEFSDPERFLVGEVGASLETLRRYYGEAEGNATNGLHLTFHLQSLNARLDAQAFRNLISRYEQHFPEPYIPTWVFSNHDQTRRISKLSNDQTKAKLNATLQLTARGVPFIYYGEEIGLVNSKFPLKGAQDPVAVRFSWLPQFFVNLLTRNGSVLLNRDECRTPMQWDSSSHAGFCPAEMEPWLPVGPQHETINVRAEEPNPDSLLNCYKALLRLRRDTPALHSGSMNLVEPSANKKELLVYERKYDHQSVEVWLNFSRKQIENRTPGNYDRVLFSTLRGSRPIHSSTITLQPYQGVVLETQKTA